MDIRLFSKGLATLVLITGLSACGGGSGDSVTSDPAPTDPPPTTPPPTNPPPTNPPPGGGGGGGGGTPGPSPVLPPPPPPPDLNDGEAVLLYSDLIRGPAGSFVTVWGQNLPSTTILQCGGQNCDMIEFDFDLQHPAHGFIEARQKIVVRFDSGSDISLPGGNTLQFDITNGSIFEITPSNMSLNGTQDGDLVYLRSGTYSQSSESCDGSNPVFCGHPGVSLVGYPGDNPVIDCSSRRGFDAGAQVLNNVTVSNIEFDCGGSGQALHAFRQGNRNNLRVVGNFIHDAQNGNSGAAGVYGQSINLFVLGNRIETTGVPGENNAHALYHGGRGVSDNVHFSFNSLYDHVGGRALQIFGHTEGEIMTNLFIRGNHIVNAQGNAGILVSHSDGPPGAAPDDPRKDWIKDGQIDFNTVDTGSATGISIRNIGIDAEIRNNALSDGSRSVYIDFAKSAMIEENCMDRDVTLDQTQNVTVQNNSTLFPSCLN